MHNHFYILIVVFFVVIVFTMVVTNISDYYNYCQAHIPGGTLVRDHTGNARICTNGEKTIVMTPQMVEGY